MEPDVTPAVEPPHAREVFRVAGPRVLRDAVAPLIAFFVAYKAVGVGAGIAAGTVVGLTSVALARREGRPGLMARIALVFIVARASAGIAAGTAQAYLAADVVFDAVLASAFLGSLATGAPLSARFAEDIFPFPEGADELDGYQALFTRLTLVWGLFFVVRGVVRLAVLLTGSVDRYVAVQLVTEALFLGLLAWSVTYAVRGYRTALAEAEATAGAEALA